MGNKFQYTQPIQCQLCIGQIVELNRRNCLFCYDKKKYVIVDREITEKEEEQLRIILKDEWHQNFVIYKRSEVDQRRQYRRKYNSQYFNKMYELHQQQQDDIPVQQDFPPDHKVKLEKLTYRPQSNCQVEMKKFRQGKAKLDESIMRSDDINAIIQKLNLTKVQIKVEESFMNFFIDRWQFQGTHKYRLVRQKLSNNQLKKPTGWILQFCAQKRCFWRADNTVDKKNVAHLLRFILDPRNQNRKSIKDYPKIVINCGSHGNNIGNAQQAQNYNLTAQRIIGQMNQIATEFHQQGEAVNYKEPEYLKKDARKAYQHRKMRKECYKEVQKGFLPTIGPTLKKIMLLNILNTSNKCYYPYVDHIIDVQCLGAFSRIPSANIYYPNPLVKKFDIMFLSKGKSNESMGYNENIDMQPDQITRIQQLLPTVTHLNQITDELSQIVRLSAQQKQKQKPTPITFSKLTTIELNQGFGGCFTDKKFENQIANKKIIDLVQYASLFPKLVAIVLVQSNINDKTLISLVQNRKKFPVLQRITSISNPISDQGLMYLAKYGQGFTALQKIMIESAEIKDQGLSAFAQSGSKFKSLKEIDFSFNKISKIGLNVLLKYGESFPCLEKVNLRGNPKIQAEDDKDYYHQNTKLTFDIEVDDQWTQSKNIAYQSDDSSF